MCQHAERHERCLIPPSPELRERMKDELDRLQETLSLSGPVVQGGVPEGLPIREAMDARAELPDRSRRPALGVPDHEAEGLRPVAGRDGQEPDPPGATMRLHLGRIRGEQLG